MSTTQTLIVETKSGLERGVGLVVGFHLHGNLKGKVLGEIQTFLSSGVILAVSLQQYVCVFSMACTCTWILSTVQVCSHHHHYHYYHITSQCNAGIQCSLLV